LPPSANIDLELRCVDEENASDSSDSRSEVNEYEILEHEAQGLAKTCSLVAIRESWQDCVVWLDPVTGQPNTTRVGYAYYVSSPSAGGG